MSLLEKFAPKIPLPGFFRLESVATNANTRLSVRWNLDGEPGELAQDYDRDRVTLLEVVSSFPGVEGKLNGLARTVARAVPLPQNWVLECGPAKGAEGFLLTFDMGTNNWEKHLEVSTVQLGQLGDLLQWIAEANKIDRHR